MTLSRQFFVSFGWRDAVVWYCYREFI